MTLNATIINQECEFILLDMEDAEVYYCKNFFSNHENWYDLINNSVNWSSFPVKVYGKIFNQPRDSFYMANNEYPYKYSGFDRKPEEWSPPVIEMKNILNNIIKQITPKHPNLNSVLGNKYKNGEDYIGPHSDSETDLSKNAYIVSVSLGTARDFIFTHKKTKIKHKIELQPGSLLLMGQNCQKNWKHEVPKRKKIKTPRINLTFRSIQHR
jgi:alkylated DNA repair dioxygenase AlkB